MERSNHNNCSVGNRKAEAVMQATVLPLSILTHMDQAHQKDVSRGYSSH